MVALLLDTQLGRHEVARKQSSPMVLLGGQLPAFVSLYISTQWCYLPPILLAYIRQASGGR